MIIGLFKKYNLATETGAIVAIVFMSMLVVIIWIQCPPVVIMGLISIEIFILKKYNPAIGTGAIVAIVCISVLVRIIWIQYSPVVIIGLIPIGIFILKKYDPATETGAAIFYYSHIFTVLTLVSAMVIWIQCPPVVIIGLISIEIYTNISIYRENEAAEREKNYFLWASLNGWSYSNYNGNYDKYYPSLQKLQQGSERHASNILSKNWNSYNAEAFNYHYETYGTDDRGSTTTHHHYLGVVLIETDHSFPPNLSISSYSPFSKIFCLDWFLGGLIKGSIYSPIVFESIDFTNTFKVTCDDRKFAYDFCHPRMMNYLLNSRSQKFRHSGAVRMTDYLSVNGNISLQVHNNLMIMYKLGAVMDVDEMEDYFIKLHDIRQLMPDFLFVS